MKRILRLASVAVSAVLGAAVTAGSLFAGTAQLYSWEGGVEGWTAADATLANSTTLGVTQGLQSLLIDNLTSGFKNDAGVTTVGSGPVLAAWSLGAAAFAGGRDGREVGVRF